MSDDAKKTDDLKEAAPQEAVESARPAENEKPEEIDLLKTKKDAMGLEELPEEIKKKLEQKKTQSANVTKGKKRATRRKKKVARKVNMGNAYVKATYNNTIVTLTDLQGNVLAWGSAGVAGFKGPKKSTPYAAQIITRIAVGKAREEFGLEEVNVYVRGVGTGRESAVRALNANGLIVRAIKDITPVPHNGCRAKKPRRV